MIIKSFLQRIQSKPKPDHPHAGLRRREAMIGLLFLSPWLVGFVLLKFLPILYTFGYSFTNFNMLNAKQVAFVGLDNYLYFLSDLRAWTNLIGSLEYFATTIPMQLIVALGLAAMLSSHRARLKPMWRLIIFLPSIIPAQAIYFVWLGFINPDSGWLNRLVLAPLGLPPVLGGFSPTAGGGGIPYLTTIMSLWSIGPGFLIMYGAMISISKDLYEAARIDGAGPLMRFLNITLPMISPAIFFSLVINLTTAFGGSMLLDRGYIFSEGISISPMSGYINEVMFSYFQVGYASTLAWIMFAVTMTITVLLFRSARRWVYFPEEGRHEAF